MAGFTRDEVADRAGLAREYVDQLIELGIVQPSPQNGLTRGDVRRVKLAETLQGAGITLEALVAGLESGRLSLGFMDLPSYQRFATLAGESFRDVSERTRLPLELLTIVREATGGAVPDPDDRMREDELEIVPALEEALHTGVSERSLTRLLRVLGDGLRRTAETQGASWRADFMDPLLAQGASVDDVVAASQVAGQVELDDKLDRAILAIWHAQQAQSWTANVISGFESILVNAGLVTTVRRPPAICFLDITGYTRLTAERGDVAAADLADSLNRLVARTSVERGGKPVKWLGDGVMVHFSEPAGGVLAALDMVDGVRDVGLPPAHVGIHAGPVLFQEGDYFGRTVNLASRIADYARPGEVLVTQEVVDEAGDQSTGYAFTDIGPVELKGIGGPVHLHAARRG